MGDRATTSHVGDVARAVGALVAIAALVAGLFLAERLVGVTTVALLRALGMPSPDAYYTGTPTLAEPALWLLAALYTAPLATAVSLVSASQLLGTGWSLRHVGNLSLTVLAGVLTFAVMSFAFDPSRTGRHEPLVRRWEELPYEGADLVFAATWVMLLMGLVFLMSASVFRSPAVRAGIGASAFIVLTAALGTYFGRP